MMDIASYCSVDWCARTLKSKYYCFDIQTGCFTMGYWMRRCVFSLCPCGALMRGDFVLQPMVNETQNPKWSPSAAHEQRRSDGAHPASATTPASKSFSWRIVQLLLAFLPSLILPSFSFPFPLFLPFLPSLLPSLFLAHLFSFPPL